MPLDPASQFVNDLVVSGRGEHSAPTDADTLRAAWRGMFDALPPVEHACEHRTLDLSGCPALLLVPPAPTRTLLVWFHGGGWVIGAPDLSLGETDALAHLANTKVLSVDYRMAPEHPFPAAYDDAIAAVQWAIDAAAELDIDPTTISVGGDSAGGNLAAAVAQHFGSQIRGQLLVYPAVDLSRESQSALDYAEGFLLNGPTMQWFANQYLGDSDRRDPRVSPLLAADDVISAVAPAHIVVAEFDPLRDDGLDYATRLRDAGVAVSVDHHDDQMHGFFSLPSVLPGAQRAIERAAEFLRGL